ncbi:MAG: DNA-directed RNA polymerase subunit L [Candidatus Methanofastidiosum methylothiophilum]|uniref:DNA-directed RNA polymerase subunit Rpo11 n=1 Tax=Candidatus Methanofastidiosum methylothiophilum TaxID=1705564 RepID=A0A150IXF1_9EURY|nr:MAG: DNA-directed RNA polymerase subunit L [Candidatus Methanofastidiosum methylthiophilus]
MQVVSLNIDVIKKDEKFMEFRIIGEDHTFCNVLRDALLKDEKVKVAAYRIDHPLLKRKEPIFVINTDGTKPPKDALLDAIERVKEEINGLKTNLSLD